MTRYAVPANHPMGAPSGNSLPRFFGMVGLSSAQTCTPTTSPFTTPVYPGAGSLFYRLVFTNQWRSKKKLDLAGT
jgi:hypothetical protein